MSRHRRQRSLWPRRFMIMTAVIAVIVALVGFSAMSQQKFELAFPLFMTVVVLVVFELLLIVINNRQQ